MHPHWLRPWAFLQVISPLCLSRLISRKFEVLESKVAARKGANMQAAVEQALAVFGVTPEAVTTQFTKSMKEFIVGERQACLCVQAPARPRLPLADAVPSLPQERLLELLALTFRYSTVPELQVRARVPV